MTNIKLIIEFIENELGPKFYISRIWSSSRQDSGSWFIIEAKTDDKKIYAKSLSWRAELHILGTDISVVADYPNVWCYKEAFNSSCPDTGSIILSIADPNFGVELRRIINSSWNFHINRCIG